MISRENAVLLACFVLAFPAVAAVEVLFALSGRPASDQLILFVGIGTVVVFPQLYLAANDDSVPPRTRVRFAVAVLVLFAIFSGSAADGLERVVIFSIGGGSFFGFAAYEFLAGYRSSSGSAAKSS